MTPSGGIVVFDYFDIDEFNEKTSNLQEKDGMMQKIGEPMKTGFDPATMEEQLAGLGLN